MKFHKENGVLVPKGRLMNQSRKSPVQSIASVNSLRQILNTGELNICIMRRLGGIGDVLMSTPSLKALKDEWPNCKITYATDFNYANNALVEVLEHNPYLDKIIAYQTVNSYRFDLVVDITSVCINEERLTCKNKERHVRNRIDIFAESIGVNLESSGFMPIYKVTNEELNWAKEKIERIVYPRKRNNLKIIGIQPSASSINRSWPIEKVRELVNKLNKFDNTFIIVFTDEKSKELWNFPNVANIKNYSISCVSALINETDLMVTPDSGLMHIAGALGKNTIAIFGSTDPESRINHYPNTIAINKKFKCSPCWYDHSPCNSTFMCMKSITSSEVLEVINNSNILLRNKSVNETLIEEKIEEKILEEEEEEEVKEDRNVNYIVRDDGLGDLVSCLPSFSAFKKAHQDEKVVLVTLQKNVNFFSHANCFDEIMPLQKKWQDIMLNGQVYDARDLFEKNKIEGHEGCYYEEIDRMTAMANFLGVVPDKDYSFFSIEENDRQTLELLRNYGINPETKKIVTIQPRATCQARSWTIDSCKKLIEKLYIKGYFPIILGTSYYKIYDSSPGLNLTGKTPLGIFNSLIKISNLFIGVDSGGIHLAGMNKVPFIAIFNSIPPELRLNFYNSYIVIVPSSLDCCPCWDKRCTTMQCMKIINEKVIMRAVNEIIGKPKLAKIKYV